MRFETSRSAYSRMSCVIRIEQNLGPHMEQKRAVGVSTIERRPLAQDQGPC
jgi:hypothetical protein